MKVDGSLQSLMQGVSQQPPRDRLPGQAKLQDNMSSDPITGLTRRPATDLVNHLMDTADLRGWHDFDTADGNRFIAAFLGNDVKVFDLNGVPQTVTVDADALPYLSTVGELRFNTIENETFVANRSSTIGMLSDVRTYFNNPNRQAFVIQVLGGQYGRTYNVKIDGVEYASFTVADGSASAHIDQTRTKYIANELYTQLTANLTGWTVVIQDDIIVLHKLDTASFTITVNDDFGNTNIKGNGETVARTEDLPRYAPHNFVCRVAENTDPETDLWFRFIVEGYEDDWTEASSMTLFGQQGYWQETVAPETQTTLDRDTMPHILEYLGAGAFQFKRGEWADRAVGTTTSNPDPSFVGGRINDVATFQGRLVFLSGPNVIMSRSNRNMDFWFGSASAQADSDPIDVRSKVEASTMRAAIQHNRDLVIFSNKGQFIVYGRNSLTPQNAALVLSSAFEAELRAKPIGAGRNVFFATNFGAYTGIREFYVESGTDINDSRAVTQHAKRYIEGRATKLVASSNYDTLLVQTDTDASIVYWYQYIWSNNEKIQSSWSKLRFSRPIVYTFFEEETVYMVFADNGSYYLQRMSLDVQKSAGVPYHIHLDNRFDVFGASLAFLLPYDFLQEDPLVAVQGTNCPNPGLTVPIESIVHSAELGGYVVTLKHDMFGGDIVVGTPYRSEYWPTMPLVKDRDGIKVGTGNLTISRFNVSLADTGEVNGQIMTDYGNSPEVRFNARVVGAVDNQVGVQPLSSDVFLMPVGHRADRAEVRFWTDSHMPMTFLDIEWEGQYTKRGKRISAAPA
ncbi:hypothetical protein [Stappia phage SI01]|uniref:Tail tubular protein B n=1 Tax=Stappia phage SI01 TaxID=2847766 RepID=A0AAE7VHI9_9CAUD|nr:hypothetical protein [Stappia phage SI01]